MALEPDPKEEIKRLADDVRDKIIANAVRLAGFRGPINITVHRKRTKFDIHLNAKF